MKLTVLSQEQFILHNLIGLIESLMQRSTEQYSSTIEASLVELVREQMRQLAQESGSYDGARILKEAVQLAKTGLQGQLSNYNFQFDVAPYLGSVQETLKYPAKEIAGLGKSLKRSREDNQIRESQKVMNEAPLLFVVTEVGLGSSIEGLLASPLSEKYELDLESLKREYLVEGEWFPFEISTEELLFVVDDDGTIFISTKGFSESVVSAAKGVLVALARQLYA